MKNGIFSIFSLFLDYRIVINPSVYFLEVRENRFVADDLGDTPMPRPSFFESVLSVPSDYIEWDFLLSSQINIPFLFFFLTCRKSTELFNSDIFYSHDSTLFSSSLFFSKTFVRWYSIFDSLSFILLFSSLKIILSLLSSGSINYLWSYLRASRARCGC